MIVAFLVEPHTYVVYHYHFDNIEITEVDDILADLVEFAVLYDPFRTKEIVVIDLSRLPS